MLSGFEMYKSVFKHLVLWFTNIFIGDGDFNESTPTLFGFQSTISVEDKLVSKLLLQINCAVQ